MATRHEEAPTRRASSNGRGPEGPADLPARSWWGVLKRAVREFRADNLSDWAAALTYYGILSIFPALLVLLSSLGLLCTATQDTVLKTIQDLLPGQVGGLLQNMINNVQNAPKASGVLAIVGLATGLWSD